jgi:hypothetical protein
MNVGVKRIFSERASGSFRDRNRDRNRPGPLYFPIWAKVGYSLRHRPPAAISKYVRQTLSLIGAAWLQPQPQPVVHTDPRNYRSRGEGRGEGEAGAGRPLDERRRNHSRRACDASKPRAICVDAGEFVRLQTRVRGRTSPYRHHTKLPNSRRYQLLPQGYSICLVFLRLFERVCAPLTRRARVPRSQGKAVRLRDERPHVGSDL